MFYGIRSIATTHPHGIASAKTFVDRARVVHGDTYDYSHVDYVNAFTKIEIICPRHGAFLQSPGMHIAGNGCQKCYDERREQRGRQWADETARDFEVNSRKLHGRKYDYSRVEYTRSHVPVEIICLLHGVFRQRPDSHLQGVGCPMCKHDAHLARMVDKAAAAGRDFIRKAVTIHDDRYDYFKVSYVDSGKKVVITCRKHGDFQQTPNKHLGGQGCMECRLERNKEFHKARNQKARDKFFQRATEVHQGKYDYSDADYIDARTKLLIRCPVHELFKQTPDAHLSGSGCIKCRDDLNKKLQKERLRKAAATFEFKVEKIHDSKYNYSEVNYQGKGVPVTIICPLHGRFSQSPHKHLQGNGCQQCAIELNLGEDAVAKVLTELGVAYERQYAPEWGKRVGQKRYGAIYDFAIHDLKILIERDGEQHYFPVRFGGVSIERAEQHHRKAVAADKKKTEMAKQNGWCVCRIPFFCEDIFEELKEILSGNPSYPDVPLLGIKFP